MQLRTDQLPGHLKGELKSVYLLAGDEPLFVQEGLDAVRAAARKAGFDEREVLSVESGFDWTQLAAVTASLSLFGGRKLVELRMPGGKPGQAGTKAITDYCKNPAADVVLLISSGMLDSRQRNSGWVKAVDKAGVFCYGWKLAPRQLPEWLKQRLGRHGLKPDGEALELLAERAEGNLLAAVQEIEKLRLLYKEGSIGLADVQAVVADSARYDVFGLADAALAGDIARCSRVLRGLRAEGVEPILVLWALARDLRLLAAASAGRDLDEVMRSQQVRMLSGRKQSLARVARMKAPPVWQRLLARCARIDRVIKGVSPGRAWDELIQLTTSYAALIARRDRGRTA